MSQCFAEDAIPPPERVQLLRTLAQSGHEAGDPQISPACQMLLAVRAADRQPHLAGMVGSPRQRGEQQRPAGDRFTMMLRIGEAHEQAPPVVDQRHTARQKPAAFEILRRETAPAPLVLQLVERVLAVCSIAIQLTEGQDLAVERGHQRGIFPDLPIRTDLGKAEPRLRRVAVIDDRQRTFQLTPQQNDPPLPAPTFQPQTGLVALPALEVRGRAIPCSDCAKQRHDIIPNRLALTAEESVSGVTGATAQVNQETPPMRIYIIGNDGITLCREPPATVNKDEVAVASREELHAARLSGKRLLALWNALPGVGKQTKVGDRDTLIDQLWSAIEALPDPEPQSDRKGASKQATVIAMLQRPEGVTVEEVASAMGWQRHTVRGLFSGTLKKKLGLALASAKEERGRVYRIAEPASA